MVKAVTVPVRRLDGTEEDYIFDGRPIQECVRSICKGFKVKYDEEDNYHVLVGGSDPTAPVICTQAQLLEAQERGGTPLVLQRASELAKARLASLQGAGDITERLWGLLNAVRGDGWIAEEVVHMDGIHFLVQAILTVGKRHVELAMASLCELFRNGNCQSYLEENREEFGTALFRQLFGVLFASQQDRFTFTPHVTLSGCLFLLQRLPSSARSAHAAAVGALQFGDSAEAVTEAHYPRMLEALEADEDDFRRGAAESLLALLSAASVGDEELQGALQRDLLGAAGRDSEAASILGRREDVQHKVDHLLAASMGACVDLAVARARLVEQSKALERYVQLERRLEHLQEVNDKMKAEMRKQHQIMCRMVPFMRIESDPVVEQSLDGIIRFGWDSLHWKRGYTMLHYTAESVEDPSVVELIGLLSTDIDRRDEDGMRPIDYARQSGREAVILLIEKLRRQKRAGLTDGFEGVPQQESIQVDTEELRSRLSQLPDLSSQLRQVIEMVLDVGWAAIEWPSDFSAMHLAAKCGHVGAVELLAAAGAELSTPDEWRLTPLDYAAQGEHHEVIRTIQRIIAERQGQGAREAEAPEQPEQGPQDPALAARRRPGKPGRPEPGQGGGGGGGGEPPGAGGGGSCPGVAVEGSSGEAAPISGEAAPSTSRPSVAPPGSGGGIPGVATPKAGVRVSFAEPGPEAREKLVVPDGIRPELQKACEAVRRKGWAKIQWPKGFTALHLAAQQGSPEVVTFLLEASAAPSVAGKDAKGLTPLDYAASKGHTHVVDMLRAFQAAERADGVLSSSAASSRWSAPEASRPGQTGAQPQTPRHTSANWNKLRTHMRVSRALTNTTRDLLAEKMRLRERIPSDIGLAELKQELKRLLAEKASWQEERARLLSSKPGAVTSVLQGPLTEADLSNYMVQYEAFGRDAVQSKLMRPGMTGGLSLDEAAATSACDQIELVMRLCESKSKNRFSAVHMALTSTLREVKGRTESSAQGPDGEDTDAIATPAPGEAGAADGGAPVPPGKGKKGPPPPGKGAKGPGPAPGKAPGPEAQSSTEEQAETASAPSKGKPGKGPPPPGGKGKGPPPPGAQSPPGPGSEEAAAAGEAAKPAGKGPPPPGGKGPPPPGGKGPPPPGGKGPPPPGGKGPPPPGGKGPPPPGGKGPPPPGGKGPAPPAGKGPAPPGGKGPAPGGKGAPAGGKGKKGGKNAVEPRKPKVKPKKQMKPLWWNRLIMGEKLKPGESVWDNVGDDMEFIPIDLLEERFAKTAPVAKKKPKEAEEKKKEEVKILKIITDPNAILQKETALKKLPPAPECARALEELDDAALDEETIFIIKSTACPSPAEMKQLTEAKQKEPNIPMGLAEQYLWVIGNLPAYQMRVDCWFFIRTYAEKHAMYFKALSEFVEVVECVRDSDMLASLLGLVLATGNYLNGDTNRGQADGFDLEIMTKLDTVKDNEGKDLRHFVISLFFNQFTDKAAQLIDEFEPILRNVTRRLAKDSDGVEKLGKQARIVFEDFDICIKDLAGEFAKANETMSMVLSFIEDPADQFKLRMPREFEKAQAAIDALVALKDKAKEDYGELLSWFKVQSMKSSDFCTLWDNFFVPGDLIVNKDVKMKSNYLVPSFCQGKPITIDDLMVLWEFTSPDDKPTAPRSRRKKKEKSRRKPDSDKPTAADSGEGTVAAACGASELPPAGAPAAGKGKGKGKAPGPPGKGTAPVAPAETPAAQTSEGAPGGEAAGPPGKANGMPPPGKGKAKGPAPAKGKAPAGPAASMAAPASETAAAGEGAAAAEAVETPATAKGMPPPGKGKAKGPPPGKGKAPVALSSADAPAGDVAGVETPLAPAAGPDAPASESAPAGEGAAAAVAVETPATVKGMPPPGKGKAKGPPPGKGKAPLTPSASDAPAGDVAVVEAPAEPAAGPAALASDSAPADEASAVTEVTESPVKAKGMPPPGKGKAKGPPPGKGKAPPAPGADAQSSAPAGDAGGVEAPVASAAEPAAPASDSAPANEASAVTEVTESPVKAKGMPPPGKGKAKGPPPGKGKAPPAPGADAQSTAPAGDAGGVKAPVASAARPAAPAGESALADEGTAVVGWTWHATDMPSKDKGQAKGTPPGKGKAPPAPSSDAPSDTAGVEAPAASAAGPAAPASQEAPVGEGAAATEAAELPAKVDGLPSPGKGKAKGPPPGKGKAPPAPSADAPSDAPGADAAGVEAPVAPAAVPVAPTSMEFPAGEGAAASEVVESPAKEKGAPLPGKGKAKGPPPGKGKTPPPPTVDATSDGSAGDSTGVEVPAAPAAGPAPSASEGSPAGEVVATEAPESPVKAKGMPPPGKGKVKGPPPGKGKAPLAPGADAPSGAAGDVACVEAPVVPPTGPAALASEDAPAEDAPAEESAAATEATELPAKAAGVPPPGKGKAKGPPSGKGKAPPAPGIGTPSGEMEAPAAPAAGPAPPAREEAPAGEEVVATEAPASPVKAKGMPPPGKGKLKGSPPGKGKALPAPSADEPSEPPAGDAPTAQETMAPAPSLAVPASEGGPAGEDVEATEVAESPVKAKGMPPPGKGKAKGPPPGKGKVTPAPPPASDAKGVEAAAASASKAAPAGEGTAANQAAESPAKANGMPPPDKAREPSDGASLEGPPAALASEAAAELQAAPAELQAAPAELQAPLEAPAASSTGGRGVEPAPRPKLPPLVHLSAFEEVAPPAARASPPMGMLSDLLQDIAPLGPVAQGTPQAGAAGAPRPPAPKGSEKRWTGWLRW